jgi:hypothetical protein
LPEAAERRRRFYIGAAADSKHPARRRQSNHIGAGLYFYMTICSLTRTRQLMTRLRVCSQGFKGKRMIIQHLTK